MGLDSIGWLDPLALGFVLAGSFAVAAMRARRGEVASAFAALRPMLHANPQADERAAMRAVHRVEAIAEAKSIVCADRVSTSGRFVSEAIHRLSDARSSQSYARWADEVLEERAARHQGVIGFWTTLADSAPAMGMIATVIGLVRMFANLDDPRAIGAPMASALIATLAGLILANLIAGPIAARLERLSADECAWQRRVLDHFTTLARDDLDGGAEPLQRRLKQRLSA